MSYPPLAACPPFAQLYILLTFRDLYPYSRKSRGYILQKGPLRHRGCGAYLVFIGSYPIGHEKAWSTYTAFNTGPWRDDILLPTVKFRGIHVAITV